MEIKTHWPTEKSLEPLTLYGNKIDFYSKENRGKSTTNLLPIFPYKNINHGLGSPLLTLLGNSKDYHDIGPNSDE